MSRRLATGSAVAVAALAVAVPLGGLARSSGSPARSARTAGPAAAAQLQSGFAAGDTVALVRRLQAAVQRNSEDAAHMALLGLAYEQRARETGDPAYYAKAGGILQRARRVQPANLNAVAGLGSLALSRHRFRLALRLGLQARAISPGTARIQGIIGDALFELGRYPAAFRAFDRYARLQPGLGAYARIAHARDILGETAGARAAFHLALDAATGQGEPEAWTRVMLGRFEFSRGHVGRAQRQYRRALAVFPGYPMALDALALTLWAQGHGGRAVATEQRAVDTIPLPQYVAQLADLQQATGARQAAQRTVGLMGAIERLMAANGVRTDLEAAVFRADHHIAPAATVALARRALRERPSIDGQDALGWALARDGRCRAALPHSVRALRLGTLDALKFFHRALIERCAGHAAAARRWARRALALNPHFSARWAVPARRLA